MLRAFNAFQITAAFAAFPALIGWLYDAKFPMVELAFWVSCISYFGMFIMMICCVFEAINSK